MSTIQQTPAAIIDGVAVYSPRHAVFPVIDPSTEEVLAEAPACDGATVHAAVSAADRAFDRWADTSLAERQDLLTRLADVLQAHGPELADLEARNTGKPRSVAAGEVAGAVAALRAVAASARTAGAVAFADAAEVATLLRREPIGVIGTTTPWHHPLLTAMWTVGPALAAGNTMVLKPSELTPLSTLRVAELAADALPPGVFNVVAGDAQTTAAALARHPRVRMVALAGDRTTGRPAPAGGAGEADQLEPGGRAPVIVLADADLDRVALRLRSASFANSGQDPLAAGRVLVAESRYDDLIAALVPAVRSLRVAGPFDREPDLGPVISERHQRQVMDFIERATAAGAEIVLGGHPPADTGYFIEPTVIGAVPPGSPSEPGEIFGPVIIVHRFADEAEALAIANGGNHGLAASVWGDNIGRCLLMARRLRFRAVWVNDHMTLAGDVSSVGGLRDTLFAHNAPDFTVVKQIAARLS